MFGAETRDRNEIATRYCRVGIVDDHDVKVNRITPVAHHPKTDLPMSSFTVLCAISNPAAVLPRPDKYPRKTDYSALPERLIYVILARTKAMICGIPH